MELNRIDERDNEWGDEGRGKEAVRTVVTAAAGMNLLISHLASVSSLSSPVLSFHNLIPFHTFRSAPSISATSSPPAFITGQLVLYSRVLTEQM